MDDKIDELRRLLMEEFKKLSNEVKEWFPFQGKP